MTTRQETSPKETLPRAIQVLLDNPVLSTTRDITAFKVAKLCALYNLPHGTCLRVAEQLHARMEQPPQAPDEFSLALILEKIERCFKWRQNYASEPKPINADPNVDPYTQEYAQVDEDSTMGLQPSASQWDCSMEPNGLPEVWGLSNKEAALKYWDAGLSIIPICWVDEQGHCVPHAAPGVQCAHPGKRALRRWKEYQKQPPTRKQIEYWWTRWPQANIGLIVGPISQGLLILDFDNIETFNMHPLRDTWLFTTPVVQTSRGVHVYLESSMEVPNFNIRSSEGRTVLDINAKNKIAILPPSTHATGVEYTRIDQAGNNILMLRRGASFYLYEALKGIVATPSALNDLKTKFLSTRDVRFLYHQEPIGATDEAQQTTDSFDLLWGEGWEKRLLEIGAPMDESQENSTGAVIQDLPTELEEELSNPSEDAGSIVMLPVICPQGGNPLMTREQKADMREATSGDTLSSNIWQRWRECMKHYRRKKCAEAEDLHPGKQPANQIRCHLYFCPYCHDWDTFQHRLRNQVYLSAISSSAATFFLMTNPIPWEDKELQNKAKDYALKFIPRVNQMLKRRGVHRLILRSILPEDEKESKGIRISLNLLVQFYAMDFSTYHGQEDIYVEKSIAEQEELLILIQKTWEDGLKRLGLQAFIGGFIRNRKPKEIIDTFYARASQLITFAGEKPSPEVMELLMTFKRVHRIQVSGTILMDGETQDAGPSVEVVRDRGVHRVVKGLHVCPFCYSTQVTTVPFAEAIPNDKIQFDDRGHAFWTYKTTSRGVPLEERERRIKENKRHVALRYEHEEAMVVEGHHAELARRRELRAKSRAMVQEPVSVSSGKTSQTA